MILVTTLVVVNKENNRPSDITSFLNEYVRQCDSLMVSIDFLTFYNRYNFTELIN